MRHDCRLEPGPLAPVHRARARGSPQPEQPASRRRGHHYQLKPMPILEVAYFAFSSHLAALAFCIQHLRPNQLPWPDTRIRGPIHFGRTSIPRVSSHLSCIQRSGPQYCFEVARYSVRCHASRSRLTELIMVLQLSCCAAIGSAARPAIPRAKAQRHSLACGKTSSVGRATLPRRPRVRRSRQRETSPKY